MADVDLSQLIPPEVVETLDYEVILADCKAALVALYPDAEAMLALESEPLVKVLEVQAYREMILRARYNDEARALLLAYATGADLDHIGITYYDGEQRLLITAGDPLAVPPTADVYEADDAYRQRLALKPESYSVAGPTGAYKFHALSAHGQVKDASVDSPQPGTTDVYVLGRTGDGTPDAETLAAVETRLSSEDVRPLSEEVNVAAATIVNYAIEVDLTIFPGPSAELLLDQVQANLDAYIDNFHALDADIAISAITAAAHVAGVKRVAVVSPAADITCTAAQAPYCTGITINIAGIEA